MRMICEQLPIGSYQMLSRITHIFTMTFSDKSPVEFSTKQVFQILHTYIHKYIQRTIKTVGNKKTSRVGQQ